MQFQPKNTLSACLVLVSALLFACADTESDAECSSGGRAITVDSVDYCVYPSATGSAGTTPCGTDEAFIDLRGGTIAAFACAKAAEVPTASDGSLRPPMNDLLEYADELGFLAQEEALVCRDSYDSAEYLLSEAAAGCSVDDDCVFYLGTDYSDQEQCLYYLGRGYGVLATTDIGALTDALESVQASYVGAGCQTCAGLGNTGESEYAVACEAGSCVARFLPDNSDGFR